MLEVLDDSLMQIIKTLINNALIIANQMVLEISGSGIGVFSEVIFRVGICQVVQALVNREEVVHLRQIILNGEDTFP